MGSIDFLNDMKAILKQKSAEKSPDDWKHPEGKCIIGKVRV